MLIVPLSLIFLSVPVSSSAPACPAQNAAANAMPITYRRFIHTLHTSITAAIPCPRNCFARAMAGPSHGARIPIVLDLHRLVGIRIGRIRRLGEFVLQLRTERHIQVEPPRRNLLLEPFRIELGALAALVERGGSAVD